MPEDVLIEEQVQQPVVDAPVAETEPDIAVEIEPTPDHEKPRLKPGEPLVDNSTISDQELSQYSERVQKEMKRKTFQFHESERQRKQAEAERDAALLYAKSLRQQASGFQRGSIEAQKTAIAALTQRTETALEQAKRELSKAHAEFDSDKIADLTAKVSQLSSQQANLQSVPVPTEVSIPDVPEPQPAVSARTQVWTQKNPWFQIANNGGPANPMSAYALSIHGALVAQGVPVDSESYYAAIDNEMRKRFPEQFEDATTQPETARTEPRKPGKPAVTVAPVVRTNSAGKKVVRLSESQVSTARKLGITPEQYAAQLVKDQANG